MLGKSPGPGKAVAGGRKFGLGQGDCVRQARHELAQPLCGLASIWQSACSPAGPEGSGQEKVTGLEEEGCSIEQGWGPFF